MSGDGLTAGNASVHADSGDGTAGTHSAAQPTPPTSPHRASNDRGRPKRNALFVGVAVAIVVILVVAAYAVELGHKSNSAPATKTLLPADFLISISPQQYYGISFVLSTTGTLNASYSAQFPTIFYIMTPKEYLLLVSTYNVSGYEWTVTTAAGGALGYLNIDVQPGNWWLAMSNPDLYNTTAVAFITPLNLTST
jgi:hypothetical protein